MVDPGLIDIVADQLGGDAHKIKPGLALREQVIVLEKGAAVEAEVVLVLGDKLLNAFNVAGFGKNGPGEIGIKVGDVRMALQQAGYGVFDDIVYPGLREKIPESR